MISQRSLFCPCGRESSLAGLCRACLRAEARFAGHRLQVLHRDQRRCRTCGKAEQGRRLHVHHRRKGVHDPARLVTLCAACHARIHRTSTVRHWLPELLLTLWAEQHPGRPLQFQLDLAA